MKRTGLALLMICFSLMTAKNAFAEIRTVPHVDLSQYVGTWYEIARNPVVFETGCVCTRQLLTANPDGKVGVYNSCKSFSSRGPVIGIHGTASVDDATTNAKLSVDFGLPWKGQYWIVGLDDQYRWAVVTDGKGDSLYILSRTPQLADDLYQQALKAAADASVATDHLELTKQTGCTYP